MSAEDGLPPTLARLALCAVPESEGGGTLLDRLGQFTMAVNTHLPESSLEIALAADKEQPPCVWYVVQVDVAGATTEAANQQACVRVKLSAADPAQCGCAGGSLLPPRAADGLQTVVFAQPVGAALLAQHPHSQAWPRPHERLCRVPQAQPQVLHAAAPAQLTWAALRDAASLVASASFFDEHPAGRYRAPADAARCPLWALALQGSGGDTLGEETDPGADASVLREARDAVQRSHAECGHCPLLACRPRQRLVLELQQATPCAGTPRVSLLLRVWYLLLPEDPDRWAHVAPDL